MEKVSRTVNDETFLKCDIKLSNESHKQTTNIQTSTLINFTSNLSSQNTNKQFSFKASVEIDRNSKLESISRLKYNFDVAKENKLKIVNENNPNVIEERKLNAFKGNNKLILNAIKSLSINKYDSPSKIPRLVVNVISL
jgi:hypothetical protein